MRSEAELIAMLAEPVRSCATTLLDNLRYRGLEVFVPDGGTLRTDRDMIDIYGPEGVNRWSVHRIGFALDVYPVIKCKPKEWKPLFDDWMYWNLYQNKLAVEAGFDKPQHWHLHHDRPHVQMIGGAAEGALKTMWQAGATVDEMQRYVMLHWRYRDGLSIAMVA